MNSIAAPKDPIVILLAEDNPADAELARFALQEAGIAHNLHIVEDGEEVLLYLNRSGKKYENALTPDIILLDLNMPKISGLEVLKEIKVNSNFSNIPVAILTSSYAKPDITDAYKSEANFYITKPISTPKILAAFGLNSNSDWLLE